MALNLLHAIAQLRHAYAQLKAGTVKDQAAFADGLIAPQIEVLEAVSLVITESVADLERIAEMVKDGMDADRLAPIIHEAMVYAVENFRGKPEKWQNGNSIAENYARQRAEEFFTVDPANSIWTH